MSHFFRPPHTEFSALSTKQDARGVITTYGYDALHRVTSKSYNTVSGVATAPTVTFIYDADAGYGTSAIGQVVRVNVGSDFQERYTFDDYKRISSVVHTLGTRTYTTSYQYNQASQLTQLTYPSTRAVVVGHDSIGRMSEVTGYLSNVSYNVAGQLTGLTLANGVVESYGYDSQRLQMTSQTAIKSGSTLLNLTYNYQASAGQNGAGTTAGNAGQLISISGTINSATESAAYTYDLQGRLVTSNQMSNTVSAQRRYGYDRWGNRTGMWDAVSGGTQIQSISLQQSGGGPTNRISNVSGVSYSYDAAGNVTNDGVHSYTYDSENRLVSVDGGATATYNYDHQNRRWKKLIGATATHYVWQGSQVLAEYDASTGAMITDYIYSGSRLIAKETTSNRRYFISDRLSVRLMLNAGGSVIGQQAHLPFGEDWAESGTQQKQHFTSYERDSESNLDYAVNRNYAVSVGRFNQADPYEASGYMADPQSWNRYSYTRNNSINRVDPLGLQDDPPRINCTNCEVNISGGGGSTGGQNASLTPGLTGEPNVAELLDGNGTGEEITSPVDNGELVKLLYYVQNVMSTRCQQFFGAAAREGVRKVATREDFALVDVDKEGTDEERAYFSEAQSQMSGGVVIATRFFHTNRILLGLYYYKPELLRDWDQTDYAKLGKEAGTLLYQQETLLHEFLHMLYNKDDEELAAAFHLAEMGYDVSDASGAISDFIHNNCQDKTKKKK